MFVLSAFADEISPDPREQIAVLKSCGVRHIEFRSIHKTNVLALSDEQIQEFKKLLDGEGFGLSAIGSPVGKIAIDAPFEPHLDKLKRAIELCGVFGTPNIRVFSYYPPGNDPNFDPRTGPRIGTRSCAECGRRPNWRRRSGVVLFHENEHRIYGDSPDRVADILGHGATSPSLRAAYDAANYVFCGFDPVEGWEKTKAYTAHFHIKDWKQGGHAAGHEYGVLAGDRRRQHRAQHSRRGGDGLQRLRHDGAAPARRRADRRRHRPGSRSPARSRRSAPSSATAVRRKVRPSAMLTVHLRINDAATGQPTPVRLCVTGPDGGSFPPLGRAGEFPTGRNEDVGGHIKIASERWYYIDGACEIPLPAGVLLRISATKGPEYRPVDQTITLGPGQISLRLAIERWTDSRADGWVSVDTRCHFLTPHAALIGGGGGGRGHREPARATFLDTRT